MKIAILVQHLSERGDGVRVPCYNVNNRLLTGVAGGAAELVDPYDV
jgi:hypothetical protein